MFRTEIPFIPHPQQLPLSARVLTIGSCFSDAIGSRLVNAKVQTLVNPFGTVFNPISACRLLRAAVGEEMDWQQHLLEARGRWQSYDLHATIGAESPVTLLQQIQDLVRQTGEFLRTADVVVLTLGSAFAYRLLDTQEIVNNCHKVPAERFEKELLTPDEIINTVAETHAFLRLQNPKLRFILTVSPVRHLKETLSLNNVSKSVLRVACHYLSELLADVAYFPAYELLLDDLRDYRFYAADMLHPSEVAENYIWERFARTYFDADFGRFRKEWESVRQALAHRPLHPAAPEHRQFLENTLSRLQRLSAQANVRAEIREVEQQLKALPAVKPVVVPEPEEDDEERIDIGPAEESIVLAEVDDASLINTADNAEETTATEEELTEETQQVAESIAAAPSKKKRRSRGGAKRTARKKAAQLAASNIPEAPLSVEAVEFTSQEAVETETEPVELPVAEQQSTLSEPISEPEPVSTTAEPSLDELAIVSETEHTEPQAPDEPTPATPKVRKGRTAGQILKAKSGRKSAKASAATAAKTARTSPARTSRRKASPAAVPSSEAPIAPVAPSFPSVTPPEASSVEAATTPSPAATKRPGRTPRKKPAKADESSSTT